MLRNLLVLLAIGLVVYAAFDVLRSAEAERVGVSRGSWLVVVLLLPVFGAIAWLVVSRNARRGRATGRRPTRPSAPDDDPEFLLRLDLEQRRRQHDNPTGGEPPVR
jgi:hypothetical protein